MSIVSRLNLWSCTFPLDVLLMSDNSYGSLSSLLLGSVVKYWICIKKAAGSNPTPARNVIHRKKKSTCGTCSSVADP